MLKIDESSTSTELVEAIRILRALDTETTTAQRLAQVMSSNPGLCRRLLRLARSPMYGVAGDDLTVGRAIVLVGFKTVRSLAVLSLARALTADDTDPSRWQAAITTGIATEQLAARTGVDSADGLVAGLLNRLVGADGAMPEDLARSVPPHILDAIRTDEFTRPDYDTPILGRLVHAGLAAARVMLAFDPGIPPSRELEHAFETTTFPGLADQRLASDIRRGVERYSLLVD